MENHLRLQYHAVQISSSSHVKPNLNLYDIVSDLQYGRSIVAYMQKVPTAVTRPRTVKICAL